MALVTLWGWGLGLAAAGLWLLILLLPWQPWRARPLLDAEPASVPRRHGAITVLIPARNEAQVIAATLGALARQAPGLKVVLVDDRSDDAGAAIARTVEDIELTIVEGAPLPAGWSGKLWALEQGRPHVATPLTLLLDADIALAPGTLQVLCQHRERGAYQLVSLMAAPRLTHFWEKLLLPAFVYFFKFLYPFRLANSGFRGVAAAAGGCVLLETRALDEIGGFAAIRDALIDDCALARAIKRRGGRTWIGLTHSALSQRGYERLGGIWDMVARTAFTQLHYSIFLLFLCTLLMLVLFVVPALLLWHPLLTAKLVALSALSLMTLSYLPTVRFYRQPALWALSLPLTGLLYVMMTWSSAIRYWRGERSRWKGRVYGLRRELNGRPAADKFSER